MVNIGKNIANCSKTPPFLLVMCMVYRHARMQPFHPNVASFSFSSRSITPFWTMGTCSPSSLELCKCKRLNCYDASNSPATQYDGSNEGNNCALCS